MLALTGLNVLCAVAAWEILHQSSRLLMPAVIRLPGVVREGTNENALQKLLVHGPSYVASFVHCVTVTYRGVMHLVALFEAPIEAKIIIAADASDPWYASAFPVYGTCVIFLSWLLYDIAHVIYLYPDVGGLDMVMHHLGFIAAACICGPCGALPFAFAWLIAGEFSTFFLDIRWLLINTGRGASAWLPATNAAFAIVFFLTRIVLYAIGLLHLWIHRQTILSTPGVCCTKPLLYLVLGMLFTAYGLNLVWMAKVVRMARGSGREKKP